MTALRRTCYAHVGPFLNGSARLVIDSGSARIHVSGLLKLVSGLQRVERLSGEVVVVRYWLRPFWMSTVVYLDSEAWAAVGWWATGDVIGALRKAGFVVHEHRALLSKPATVRACGLVSARVPA